MKQRYTVKLVSETAGTTHSHTWAETLEGAKERVAEEIAGRPHIWAGHTANVYMDRDDIIINAREHGIELSYSDFAKDDGVWTLDGMDAVEWYEAMTSE